MNSYHFGRQSGILLHPTCIPSQQGIGTLGDDALAFVDFACEAGARIWQVCPLGPTGYGDSPYQCFSAYAGNPLLIDLEDLVREGYLDRSDLRALKDLPYDRVDFGSLIPLKHKALAKAWTAFKAARDNGRASARTLGARIASFIRDNGKWLPDFSLFMALKDHFDGKSWNLWPQDIRDREQGALHHYRAQLADAVAYHEFLQVIVFHQWYRVKAHAAASGIRILGDMPIFVAYDSADVWARRELFQLDDQGLPTAVAGVPPDYFSPTGQLWGNPLYRWEIHRAEGFTWWIDVIRSKLRMYDYLRIDHFRGFAAYWAVPFGDPTAERGTWIEAPGKELFTAIHEALGSAPIIAEDLGLITPDVIELIAHFNFPGMKVLQFAFDSDEGNDHVPHNYRPHSVVYTGTHDNDTVRGWWQAASEADQRRSRDYLGLPSGDKDIQWGFIRAALSTVAEIAVVPLQDILGLDSRGRMNTPGTLGGNWSWRYLRPDLKPALAERFRKLCHTYGR